MPTYVAGDIRNIQGYVFGSPRLLEMRGASALVDAFDHGVVPDLVAAAQGKLVSSGGGNFLARFEDTDDRPAALAEAVRNAFFDTAGSDGIVVVQVASERPFPEVQKELRQRLAAAKRAPSGAVALASMPLLMRCESCGREAAETPFRRPAEEAGEGEAERRQWLGPVCTRKRHVHARLREAQKTGGRAELEVYGLAWPVTVPAVSETLAGARLASDFLEVAGEGDLAIVVADGNGLGGWFEEVGLEAYETLSREVDEELRRTLDAAVGKAFGAGEELSLQVLICGGDDLVVALPAARALPFARALLDGFRPRHPERPGEETGLAVGLVFAKPTFPFRQAHDLAEELLHRAKDRCRRDGVRTALDLYRVTATHLRSLAGELAAIERFREDGSGWAYGAAGPYTPDELDALLALARRLRGQVTASQRGRLREILSPRDDGPETPVDADWQVPVRVRAELCAWLERQEERPFELPAAGLPAELLRVETVQEAGGPRTRTCHRWVLADALLLAETLSEEA